ncbi:MAG: ribonuclease P protein component [Zoogloeaceae bacterium]|nr:ribonuclease P protein component [Zoogloeaceae bacterium]
MNPAPQSFPRSCRMLQADDYAAVFGFKRALRSARFLLHYGAERTEAGEARLGLVIGKKFMRRAVGRNTIKRVARETFRQMRVSLPSRDWVLRLATKIPKPDRAMRQELVAEISQLLTKAASQQATRPQKP